MKKLLLLVTALAIGTSNSFAGETTSREYTGTSYNYGSSFIFLENGVTFSVYPDGEFDFYIDNRANVSASVGVGPVGFTFNSGFDYNPYVQYDDYGAVIQVENIPVYYDYYGRVQRIGSVDIRYRNGRAYRIGGMFVYYNPAGIYNYHTGYINGFNRVYVYRPWHRYFIRPAVGFCMVYNRPYRRYYQPVRYTYYRPYNYNTRRVYAAVGKTYRYAPRTERAAVYRNDKRVTARTNDVRSNARYTDKGAAQRSNPAYSTRDVRKSTASDRGRSHTTSAIKRDRSVTSTGSEARHTADRRMVSRTNREVSRNSQSRNVEARPSADRKVVNRTSREVSRSPHGRKAETKRSVTVRTDKNRSPNTRSRETSGARKAGSGRRGNK